jgi:hypothetical protein
MQPLFTGADVFSNRRTGLRGAERAGRGAAVLGAGRVREGVWLAISARIGVWLAISARIGNGKAALKHIQLS